MPVARRVGGHTHADEGVRHVPRRSDVSPRLRRGWMTVNSTEPGPPRCAATPRRLTSRWPVRCPATPPRRADALTVRTRSSARLGATRPGCLVGARSTAPTRPRTIELTHWGARGLAGAHTPSRVYAPESETSFVVPPHSPVPPNLKSDSASVRNISQKSGGLL